MTIASMRLLVFWILLALTVALHVAGHALLLRRLVGSGAWQRGSNVVFLLVGMAWWMLLIHLAAIALWGLFYWWLGFLPDLGTAFYFSGVTYTTTGYGDIVLPEPWRLFGPVQALVGILMCSLSTGLFFTVVNRLYMQRTGNTEKEL
jgi:hypothetical protein